jgi:hypothetical protein
VIDRAADRLDGTALEGLTDGEITADVLDGCATADRRDADAFAARLSEIVAGRVTRAGEPPGGEASAAYSSVLEAAFREVCPAGFSAVADGGGGPAETVFAEETDSALEALGIGLEGTAFEGLPDDRFPAAELAAVLEGVCTKVEGGGSNVDVADLVAGEFLQRFDADRQQVDHLVAVVSTAAVTYLCPEYAETVLGP